jgi:glycine/D-amino acid oxidase-like deaminating enzyme
VKAVVIGGGIAGVFTAYFLREYGLEVVGLGSELRYPLTSLVLTLSMPDPRDIELAKESLEIYKSFTKLKPITSADIMPSWVDLSPLKKAGVAYSVASEFRGIKLRNDEIVVLTTDYLVPVRRIVARLRRILGFSDSRAELRVDGRTAYAVVDGEAVKADVVVLAAGPENSALASAVGIELPFKAYECYAAVFLVPRSARGLSIGDYVAGWYGRPGPWPFYIAGDGCGGPGEGPPPGYARRLSKLMSERIGWAIPLFSRAGLCEGSPTGGPIAGYVQGYDNLFIIGGLDGYGSMVGPALARRLAEAIARGELEGLEPIRGRAEFDPCIERHDWGVFTKR